MTAADALWLAGALAGVALVIAGPVRWLNRWSRRRHDALAAARRVEIHLVKTPDEEPPPARWGRP